MAAAIARVECAILLRTGERWAVDVEGLGAFQRSLGMDWLTLWHYRFLLRNFDFVRKADWATCSCVLGVHPFKRRKTLNRGTCNSFARRADSSTVIESDGSECNSLHDSSSEES